MSVEQVHDRRRRFYEQELSYLRSAGHDFAERYPKIAARLAMGGHEACADPQVERLIEAVAFLNSRISATLDEGVPEISTALLEILYPHMMAPIPAMAIARFEARPDAAGQLIARGTPLAARASNNEHCWFRTTDSLRLWPIKVEDVHFADRQNFGLSEHDGAGIQCVLRVRLRTLDGVPLNTLPIKHLRLHLAGPPEISYALYELVMGSGGKHGFRDPDGEKGGGPTGPWREPPAAVGFGPGEAALPERRGSHPGYRLIQEYFAFPQKFLFLDLDLTGVDHFAAADRVEAFILLRQRPTPSLMAKIRPEHLLVGCVPVVNLFDRVTDPLRIDGHSHEYPLVPDSRRYRYTEIHSIERVMAATAGSMVGTEVEPFYGFGRQEGGAIAPMWYARRIPAERAGFTGTEMRISLREPDKGGSVALDRLLYAKVRCTNRDLPQQLMSNTVLHPEQETAAKSIYCLQPPSPPMDPPLGGQTPWRLISQLALNHLSLVESAEPGSGAAEPLRALLRVHRHPDGSAQQRQIDGLIGVACERVARCAPEGPWRGFRRGLQIKLTLRRRDFAGGSALLFASVLQHFLSSFAAVNSFIELTVECEGTGAIQKWGPGPTANGTRAIL